MVFFGVLSVVVVVDFVVGRDVGCYKTWIIRREAASFKVEVGKFTHLEQCKVSLMLLNYSGIATLAKQ